MAQYLWKILGCWPKMLRVDQIVLFLLCSDSILGIFFYKVDTPLGI